MQSQEISKAYCNSITHSNENCLKRPYLYKMFLFICGMYKEVFQAGFTIFIHQTNLVPTASSQFMTFFECVYVKIS